MQNTIEARGNLCTELGAAVFFFMSFNNIQQKCIRTQKQEDKKIKIKYIVKRKQEVYPI